MATIINDRDVILQAATTRLNAVTSNYISFSSSGTGFTVNGTTVTPSSITLTFTMNGRLVGNPTISYSGITGGTVVNVSSTVTNVTILPGNMTADTCTVTASLTFMGVTYSTPVIVSGSVTAPGSVGAVTTSVEGLRVKLSWPRNAEVDVIGYEVRDTNTGWGIDNNYLYNGSATSCTVPPGTLNVLKTYYIKAYDTSKLYSATATTASYTVVPPTAPTNLNAIFSTTSATISTATLTWDNTIPPFGLKQYRVRITLPNSTFTDSIVNTPNIIVNTSWTGTAVATVYVTDSLGNESLASTGYNLLKNSPNNVTTPITISTVGNKLLLDWVEVVKTSLPIVAYEVRTSDTNWGDGTTFLWKGAVSECQVPVGAVGTPVSYYVKAIDSDNIYSTAATATVYTRTAPPTISAATYVYSTTTAGQANVTFNWARPAGETFALELYRVTLTKPGPVVVTADIYANSWTVNADWVGTATLDVKTLDSLQTLSTTSFTKSIIKVPVNTTSCVVSTTPVNNTLVLSWNAPTTRTGVTWTRSATTATITDVGHGYETGALITISASSDIAAIPLGTYTVTYISSSSYSITCLNAGAASGTFSDATVSSLPVDQYEIRASNNSTVLYRGSSLNYAVQSNNIALGSNTYYLYAIDTAGKYSNSKTINYTYTILSGITTVSGYPAFTINGTALFKWTTPPNGSFAVTEYALSLTGSFGSITAIRSTTDWEVPVNWTNSVATLTVTPKDALGTVGTPSTITLTNTLLSAPSAPTVLQRGTNLELDWADNVISATQLPVGWYELRDYTNTNVVWKGSSSWASISLVGVTPANSTWYLYAYDSNGYAASTYTTYTYPSLTNPSPVPAIVYSFGTNISDSILTLTWSAQSPTFGLKHYRVSYPDWSGDSVTGTAITVTTTVLSNTINISPIPRNTAAALWTGAKTFTVVVVDQLGNESTPKTQDITKNGPGLVSNFNAQVIDNNVLLSWVLPTRTTLPIDTVRIKKGGTSWNTATSIGDKTGTFTTILERSGGAYTYWIAAVDSDGVEGTASSITATVAQPPDYIFNGQLFSQFNGTVTGNVMGGSVTLSSTVIKSNALTDASGLVMPVDIASSWTTHFTANAWTAPQDQVNAGYPIYIQPTVPTSNYTEIFDFGQVFSSTKITVNALSSTVAGTVTPSWTIDVTATVPRSITWSRTTTTATITDNGHGYTNGTNLFISISSDVAAIPLGMYTISGVTTNTYTITCLNAGGATGTATANGNWLPAPYAGTSMFGANFRYVKISLTVTEADGNHGLFRLSALDVSLDSKAVSDAGTLTTTFSSTDDGAVANFNITFIDVTSINLTAGSYTTGSPVGLTPIYDYKDAIILGTYSVTSNVCTVTTTQPHGNIVGQKVRLSFTSGTASPSGTYTVTSITGTAASSTSFTVALTTANTSGNVSCYSQGMRIYLWNSSTGQRYAGNATVTWAVRGY